MEPLWNCKLAYLVAPADVGASERPSLGVLGSWWASRADTSQPTGARLANWRLGHASDERNSWTCSSSSSRTSVESEFHPTRRLLGSVRLLAARLLAARLLDCPTAGSPGRPPAGSADLRDSRLDLRRLCGSAARELSARVARIFMNGARKYGAEFPAQIPTQLRSTSSEMEPAVGVAREAA